MVNTSLIYLSLKYLDRNYESISNISKWIFNELFIVQYNDSKLLRALDDEDFEIINILIKFIRDKDKFGDYLSWYYFKIYQINECTTIKINNLRNVIKLLIEISEDLNQILYMVCQEGDYEIAKLLIEKGLKINAENDLNLIDNASKIVNSLELVKLLVNNGARIGKYALPNASLYGHYDIVKFLIENGADIHEENDISLIHTCENNNLELVKFLIENGANIHARDNKAITNSNICGHFDIVKLLLDNGADYNIQINTTYYFDDDEDKPKNNSILVNAAIHNRYDIIEILINRNEDKYEYDVALTKACKYGHFDIVKLLIDNGANINSDALNYACENGYFDIVKLLIDNRVTISNDLLLKTSKNGYFDVIKLLIENGADIHTSDNYILKYACKYGCIDIVKLFLDYFISNKILLKTVKYGHKNIIKLLLDYLINVDKIILVEAIRYNRSSIIKLLKAKMKIYS